MYAFLLHLHYIGTITITWYVHVCMHVARKCSRTTSPQDELLAELEELEQEELEGQLLDVETPSEPLEDPSEQLPEVRKYHRQPNHYLPVCSIYNHISPPSMKPLYLGQHQQGETM